MYINKVIEKENAYKTNEILTINFKRKYK